jgi:hypothetical protein
MTKTTKPESTSSQLERLDHAQESKLIDIIKDSTDAITKADKERTEKRKE